MKYQAAYEGGKTFPQAYDQTGTNKVYYICKDTPPELFIFIVLYKHIDVNEFPNSKKSCS